MSEVYKLLDSDVFSKYQHLFKFGKHPGYKFPISAFNYHLKLGSTTTLYAPPYTGKSFWWFWLLLVFSQEYGLKHMLYTPEMGRSHEIYARLAEMLVGKKFEQGRWGMEEHEFEKASAFINEHFLVMDGVNSMHDCWALARRLKEDGNKFHTMTIDPWNALIHDPGRKRSDLHLAELLTENILESQKMDMHSCIITHSTKMQKQIQKDSGVSYYPQMDASQIAEGQAWARKGQMMLSLWRPAEGMFMPGSNQPYEEGYMVLDIQKVKPPESGTAGKSIIFYDWRRQTYYEMNEFNQPHYPLNQIGYENQEQKSEGSNTISANHDFENEKSDLPF